MMIETTNHDWIRILILDVMSNLIDKVENENSNYNKKNVQSEPFHVPGWTNIIHLYSRRWQNFIL